MSDASLPALAGRGVEVRLGGWLALAAAPTFAGMALWSIGSGGQPDMVCMAARGSPWLGEMTVMYLLMSAAHLAPWLRLRSRRASAGT